MYVDGIVALSLVGCCLVFFLVVALFSALFHRSLGTAQIPKSSEKNDLETQDNATIPLVTEDAQLEYTTEIVQPEDTSSAHGYPHYEDEDSDDSSTEPDLTASLSILLRYDRHRKYLLVRLLNMLDLPTRKDNTKINLFLEVRLLPNFGSNPIKTDVYLNTSSQKLQETFEFEVEPSELSEQKIDILVMDAREFSNRYIGSTLCAIEELNQNDLMSGKEVQKVLTIGKTSLQKSLSLSMTSLMDSGDEMVSTDDGSTESENELRRTRSTVRLVKDWEYVPGMKPMILLSLYYETTKENLVLGIIKLANLQLLRKNKKPDPYVKVSIQLGNKTIMKKKTAVMKQELNPLYNQKLEFHVLRKDLNKVKLMLSIKNQLPTRGSRLRNRPAILYDVMLGDNASGSFLEHWKAAINASKPVTNWHALTS